MGIFDKIKNALTGSSSADNEFEEIIQQLRKEFTKDQTYLWNVDIAKTTIWTDQVKNWPDKKRISFALFLVQRMVQLMKGKTSFGSEDKEWQLHVIASNFLQTIFRNKLLMDEDDVILIYNAFNQEYTGYSWSGFSHWPTKHFVNQLEKQYKDKVIAGPLKEILLAMKETLGNDKTYYYQKDNMKLAEKIDALLFGSENKNEIKPVKLLGDDPLAAYVNPAIDNMKPEERNSWYQLLAMAQKASGSKPSQKYLDEAKKIITELGTDKYKKQLHEWLQFLVNLKEKEEQHSHVYGEHTYTHTTYEYITSVNADAVKGLVWTCAHFHDNTTIQTIASLAERAYKKIPGKGPTAASVGNACLYVLYKSKGLDGIGQLSRLRLRIKQGSTQNQIDKYLQAAAEEQGVTVSEIEDMAVDDGGLVNGTRHFLFDDYKAELVITGVGKTEPRWYKPDGSPQKSVPAIVKEKHAAKYKKLKEIAKQVEQTLVAQRDRIDRMFRDGRLISWDNFEKFYLQHGLMQYLAHKIIWNFHKGENTVQAIYLNNYWVNAANEIVVVEQTEKVSLWHPVQATVAEIKAWRDFFVFHQLQQPLKQAFREVYLLTDAEVNTRTYSNRMAAHILRQHQFNSLAKARGWRYSLMGAYDNGIENDKASLTLAEHHLRAEYWINEVNADDAFNDTGIWNYVSTDQVRFINTTTNEVVEMVAVRPLIFSEVMRDVDLFVGVASVGNDPTWSDTGGIPAYRDYWQSYSFGELSEVAKNRKEILASLVPRLKIKQVATIQDKFLVVKGKLRTYKIHIGSTNILMEPNDQYLCIVPDRSAKNHTDNLFLPFEGDNGLSIILSKAFLLADDDKITDTTITSQINRK
jgi:Domain of unknown function (DUF4132)